MALTFLAVLPPEPKRTQTSISLVCKTGLTNTVVLALWSVLSTSILQQENKEKGSNFYCHHNCLMHDHAVF